MACPPPPLSPSPVMWDVGPNQSSSRALQTFWVLKRFYFQWAVFKRNFFSHLKYILIIRITFDYEEPFVKWNCSMDVKGSSWNHQRTLIFKIFKAIKIIIIESCNIVNVLKHFIFVFSLPSWLGSSPLYFCFTNTFSPLRNYFKQYSTSTDPRFKL